MAQAEDDVAKLQQFVQLTGSTTDQAAFMLEATHGNLEQAIQMYLDSHQPAAQPRQQAGADASQLRQRPQARTGAAAGPGAGDNAAAGPAQHRRRGGPPGFLALPLRIVTSGIHVMASVVQLTFSLAGMMGDKVLPASVMRAARGLAHSLMTITAEPPDAATQAADFIAAFTVQYGDTHPAWLATSWRDAATAAHADFKFLFVYLHSPEHENTDAYVRNVLCNPETVEYVNSHFVSWGGNVQLPDAFNLAGRLNVSTYPCVALLAFSGSRTKLVAAAQGNVRPQQLLTALRRAVDEQEVMLTAERLEQEERELSRRLLAEQNAEYEASLAADREREARRQEEARKAEAEAQQRAAEEARVRAEQEAAEQRRLQAAASIAARRQHKAAALPPQPEAGTPGIATIRVRLPDGQNHQRRFEPSATVQTLYDWVDSLEGFDSLSYSLVCAFPKRVFEVEQDGKVTLEAAGLVPQGALFVQVHDD